MTPKDNVHTSSQESREKHFSDMAALADKMFKKLYSVLKTSTRLDELDDIIEDFNEFYKDEKEKTVYILKYKGLFLMDYGDVLSARGQIQESLEQYTMSFECFMEALLEQDIPQEDEILCKENITVLLTKKGDMFLKQGKSEDALKEYQESAKYFELYKNDSNSADIKNRTKFEDRLARVYDREGVIHSIHGKNEEAIDSFKQSLKVREGIVNFYCNLEDKNSSVDSNEDYIDAKRLLAVSYNRQSEILPQMNDTKGAIENALKAFNIRSLIVNENPNKSQHQRNLCVTLDHLGNAYSLQGHMQKALDYYEKSLFILQDITKKDPTNAEWVNDLALSLLQVGALQQMQGDNEKSMASIQEGVRKFALLVSKDKNNYDWLHGHAVALEQLGTMYARQSNFKLALDLYNKSVEIFRNLVEERDKNNYEWKYGFSVVESLSSEILYKIGKIEDSRKIINDVIVCQEKLVEYSPSNVEWDHALMASKERLGIILFNQGEMQSALKLFEECLESDKKKFNANTDHFQWQYNISLSLIRIADIKYFIGDKSNALLNYEESYMMCKSLAARDITNLQCKYVLVTVLYKLLLWHKKERPSQVKKYLTEALEVLPYLEQDTVYNIDHQTIVDAIKNEQKEFDAKQQLV